MVVVVVGETVLWSGERRHLRWRGSDGAVLEQKGFPGEGSWRVAVQTYLLRARHLSIKTKSSSAEEGEDRFFQINVHSGQLNKKIKLRTSLTTPGPGVWVPCWLVFMT